MEIDNRTPVQKIVSNLRSIIRVGYSPYQLKERGGNGISSAAAYQTKIIIGLLDKVSASEIREISEMSYVSDRGKSYSFKPYIDYLFSLLNAKKAKAPTTDTVILNLIDVLRKETEELKSEYIVETIIWAQEQVERNIARKKKYSETVWPYPTKMSFSEKKYYNSERKFYYNSPSYFFDKQKFTEKALKDAETHYEFSLQKLASRIKEKGLNLDKLIISSGRLGSVNFEVKITDGNMTVKAWTITAWGEVYRPHYRYLIK